MKRVIRISAVAAGLVLASAGAASAGEYTGNGGAAQGGANGASECAYSGQDQSDDSEDNGPGGEGDDDFATVPGKGTSTNPSGVRVQNWGQYVVLGGGGNGSGVPGQACRGNGG